MSLLFKTEYPFVPLEVTNGDLVLDCIAFGWFFGFAYFVFIDAIRETQRATRKFSGYIVMIWLEIASNIGFAVLSWAYLNGHIAPGLGVFVGIIICWITQIQCIMLIIANRTCLLYSDRKVRMLIKGLTAAIVTCISISVACIWIPAQLQISQKYIALNHWYDKLEKSIYLVLDAVLNILFIRTIKKRLVDHGLTKYDQVVKFNEYIIFVSVAMDGFLLGMTTLRNTFVYCQFHPITYIVKLKIEMSMSQLIVSVARSTGVTVYEADKTTSRSHDRSGNGNAIQLTTVHVSTHVYTHGGSDDFHPTRSSGEMRKGEVVDVDDPPPGVKAIDFRPT